MNRSLIQMLAAGSILFAIAPMAVGESQDELIQHDRDHIQGTWRIVALEINGNKSGDDDVRKLSVVNGSDGTWSLVSAGKEITRGTSTFDPTKKPKTIDFTPTEGDSKGQQYLGIYELGEKTRRMCFAQPGNPRPNELLSSSGSDHILVTFERDREEAIKIDRRRIEGIWEVVQLQLDGNQAMDEDARKLKVVIGIDGSWNLTVEGKDVMQGTSTIDPLESPRMIEFIPNQGDDKGKQSLGIYEVFKNRLRFCVTSPGMPRPKEFSSAPGSQQTLLTFERKKIH